MVKNIKFIPPHAECEFILGIDSAHCSLGLCLVRYWRGWQHAVRGNIRKAFGHLRLARPQTIRQDIQNFVDTLRETYEMMDAVFEYRYLQVIDILDEQVFRETTDEVRAVAQREFLDSFAREIGYDDRTGLLQTENGPVILTVAAESQMIGVESRDIEQKMLLYFAHARIVATPTAYKKKLCLVEGYEYSKYLHYSTAYTGNKAHARDNFRAYMEEICHSHMLKRILTKRHPDIADSFFAVVIYIHDHNRTYANRYDT